MKAQTPKQFAEKQRRRERGKPHSCKGKAARRRAKIAARKAVQPQRERERRSRKPVVRKVASSAGSAPHGTALWIGFLAAMATMRERRAS